MTNIIITSHGNYATGIYDTLKYFSGDLTNIYCVCLEDKSVYDFEGECQGLIDSLEGSILVLTDLFQGTPFKTFYTKLINRTDAKIISNISFVHALHAAIAKKNDLAAVVNEVENAGVIEITDTVLPSADMSDEDE